MSEEELLERAAADLGVDLQYTDAWGKTHQTSPDVLKKILNALGAATSTPAEMEHSLAQHAARTWQQAVDSTLVVREDTEVIRIQIPASRKGASVKLEIEWENAGTEEKSIEHHWYWIPELRTLETAVIKAESGEEHEVIAKALPLPKPLRLGYHRMRLHWVQEPELETFAEAGFIVCPTRAKAVDRRLAGVGFSLYGLRSARNWGCGDFSDLYGIIDAYAPAGAAFIALNPLHALANRQPYNTSPYLPECSFFRNYIYLDVDKIAAEQAGAAYLDESSRKEIEALRASELIEYERVAQLKLAAGFKIFLRFITDGGSHEFDAYTQAQGQSLADYAVYCVLYEEMHRHDPNVWLWTQWPEAYRDPRSPEVRQFAQEHQTRVTFFKFLQWHLAKQAAEVHAYALAKGMPIGLYHDLALATDRFGADLWAQRPFYVLGAKVGAPPDILAPGGQDWAFPPPSREQHRADGYRLFAQSIRSAAAQGGALRIDHVMRFFRLYWIPEGADASQGTYVRDYHEDLLGVLALESVRGSFVVIGEDLGTVTDEVRRVLADKGVLSYRLLMFERDASGRFHAPSEYPAHALVSTTTHDLPTLAGFAAARDIDARKAAGLIDDAGYEHQRADRRQEVEKLQKALEEAQLPGDPLGFVLATPCLLALVNQEDLTGETEQQNLPGSTWQYPNWRRKMTMTVDEFAQLADKFGALVRQSQRT